jgi:hypothetical protein
MNSELWCHEDTARYYIHQATVNKNVNAQHARLSHGEDRRSHKTGIIDNFTRATPKRPLDLDHGKDHFQNNANTEKENRLARKIVMRKLGCFTGYHSTMLMISSRSGKSKINNQNAFVFYIPEA